MTIEAWPGLEQPSKNALLTFDVPLVSSGHVIIYLLYNRTHGTTKLKNKCKIKLIRMQRILAYKILDMPITRPI